jgi:hypothetical protein
VLFALTSSTRPIVRLETRLNGALTPNVQPMADDLRFVAGSYFDLPATAGTYQLTVAAFDALGCSDGAARPMTIVVQ